jgi:hypothetical protein
MTRRALAVGAIAAALCLSGVATAAPQGSSLRLTLVSANEGDLGPRSFFFTDTVYQGGRAVGTSRAVCRFTRNFESNRCRITVSLPAGKLFVFLRLTPDPWGSFKVTGGTGKYRGKTGIGIYRPGASETVTRITAWLT